MVNDGSSSISSHKKSNDLATTIINHRPSALSTAEIVALDQRHVWHPYAPVGTECIPVASTNGVHITLHDGTILIDGMSSWWAAIYGYNHPHIIHSVQDQLQKMPHIMFGGLTHEPAVRLAVQLATMTKLPKIFYSDSGSVAVEVACKMAIQYHHHNMHHHHHGATNNGNITNNNNKKKTKFLTVRNGYHGDTWQCMSVSDPVNGMHHLFQSALRPQFFAPSPSPAFDAPWWGPEEEEENRDEASSSPHLTEFEQLLSQHADEIAAVILEPIVQGAGGMRFYHVNYLIHVRRLCNIHNVLLIYDEIATGFGRTGKLFAKDYANGMAEPDILCLGKALTGGTMSLAATLTTEQVARAFSAGNSNSTVLMHGPTFMGNPLACAAALASLELIETGDWQTTVPAISKQLRDELAPCRTSPYVHDVRVLGAIGVVEFKQPIRNMKVLVAEMIQQHGVWLRPFGKLLYTMPPYIIQPDQLRQITHAMVQLSRKLF
jgi:adenosylmethionine---8-amino-7-oxononanoate aminotransferase